MSLSEEQTMYNFRNMLADLSEQLNPDDLPRMKFLCAFIPKRRLESINSCLELWEALMEREKISPTNLEFLRQLLQTVGRVDLHTTVDLYERHRLIAPGVPLQESSSGHLAQEIQIVVDNLGKNWKSLARQLGISDVDIDAITEKHNRDLKEQCREALVMWKTRENQRATNKVLVEALCGCKQRRIAQMLGKLQ